MSSCEAELVALCDLAIELLRIVEVVAFLGHQIDDAIEVKTDSKAAYDLCHRFTSAQNSRHVDRKVFKMRELRGAGRVVVHHTFPARPTRLTYSPRCSVVSRSRSIAKRYLTFRATPALSMPDV